MSETKGRGGIAAQWWRENLANRESGRARGLAARLRRAEGIEALAEPEVAQLAHRLELAHEAGVTPLLRLVTVLAELREDAPESLARRLGGAEPVISTLRFQRLMRARGEEATTALRRAVVMADRRANAARLAGDLLIWDHPDWGDAARARWCFDYFGAPPPAEPPAAPEAASEETDA
jgi:CRISPR system Cascade subunit CasB